MRQLFWDDFASAHGGQDRQADRAEFEDVRSAILEVSSMAVVRRSRILFRKPLTLMLIAVGLLTFLIQSGDVGTSDTEHRLQVAHSWWTGELQVAPAEYPDFGLHGRGGKLYAWYGIGQSLVLFPFDVLGSEIEKLPVFHDYADSGASPSVRNIVVSFSVNILINLCTALFASRLLALMQFTESQSILGTLALLCATTHFYYAQNMQENNYIFLLTLVGIYFQMKWALASTRDELRGGDWRWLAAGSAALGLNLLTRLTTILDLAASALLVLLILKSAERTRPPRTWTKAMIAYVRGAAPIYAGFFFLDRLYQFMRFGSWTNTYVDIFAADQKRLDPSLPASFPFNGYWFHGGLSSGVLGPLFSPSKSIFLFDPLLIVTIVMVILLWPKLPVNLRIFTITTLLLVGAYIAFYARYFWWSGDFSWGDRYVSSAVELACFLGVPILAKYWTQLNAFVRRTAAVLSVVSLGLQLASVAFWLPLEIYQAMARSYPSWIQGMRIRNIMAQFVVQFGGHRPAWAPPLPQIDDAWDYLQITTWNLLPSLLRHTGEAPIWVVGVLELVWTAAAIAFTLTSIRLYVALARGRTADIN